jgi:hypothetical protein
MVKLYRRWTPDNREFFVNERGEVRKPTTADEIVESDRTSRVNLTINSGQVTLFESRKALAPLAEFDRLCRDSAALRGVSLAEATRDMEKQNPAMVAQWRKLGLSPEAAVIAAKVQEAEFSPDSFGDLVNAMSKARR